MKNILESTGYSYSGISDIIRNEPEKTVALLQEIDKQYLEAKDKMSKIEKELETLKMNRGMLVSSFLHAHQALKLGDAPLCFITDNKAVVVKRLEENRIDYESYPLISLM